MPNLTYKQIAKFAYSAIKYDLYPHLDEASIDRGEGPRVLPLTAVPRQADDADREEEIYSYERGFARGVGGRGDAVLVSYQIESMREGVPYMLAKSMVYPLYAMCLDKMLRQPGTWGRPELGEYTFTSAEIDLNETGFNMEIWTGLRSVDEEAGKRIFECPGATVIG